jgi:hypothetical protein
MAIPLQYFHYPFLGNRFLTQDLYQSYSRFHCTTAHIKSLNHTLILPRPSSDYWLPVAISYRPLNFRTHSLGWTELVQTTTDPRYIGSGRKIQKTRPQYCCDVIGHAQAARTQRKHCTSIVGRVLWALLCNDFTCHTTYHFQLHLATRDLLFTV